MCGPSRSSSSSRSRSSSRRWPGSGATCPRRGKAGRFLNAYAVAAVAAGVLEIAYIVLQSARGVGSHFNTATPLEGDGSIRLMGDAALMLITGAARWCSGSRSRARTGADLAPAFRLVGGARAGADLRARRRRGHRHRGSTAATGSAAAATDAGGLPVFGWTRTGGDLRVGAFLRHPRDADPAAARSAIARLAAGNGDRLARRGGVHRPDGRDDACQALAGRPFLGFIG